MKAPKHIRNFALATSIAALLAVQTSQAANLYWDSNGTGTAGAGDTPTGIWGSDLFWSTDSTGANVGSPVLTAITTSADDVFFSAGTDAVNAYTIGLNSATQNARLVTFEDGIEDGTVTLNNGTLSLGNGGGITVSSSAATGATTISSGLSISGRQTFNVAAGKTLTLGTGTFTRNAGATLNVLSTGTVNTTMRNLASGSLVNNIIGPWATFNTGTSMTYATINGSNNIVGLGYTGGADGSSVTNANSFTSPTTNYTFSGAISLTGNRTANTIRYTGGTTITTLGSSGTNTLTLNGILAVGASGTLTITRTGSSTGTVVIGNSNELVIAGQQNVTISAPISGASGSLNYNGTGTLLLSSTANTYTGSTTISQGTLSAAATASLGDGSATNTLIFNGGTLQATGTITSPAARGVIMTSTGLFDTNGQAISIAGNITGAGGLTKSGTGTLALSGANTYTGLTTVNAGTLAITKQAALPSNTAATLNVKSGATLALNVDSAGTAGFTSTNLNTLLGNISVANTAAEGLQSGAILGLDTGTATGATFTQGNVITNSTGASGGAIGLTKLGAGTLVLDKANTFSGTTTVSEGTLSLTNALALQNSALVTTTGTSTMGAFSALTLGGLSGSRDLGSANVLNGYTGNVSALTLNPQTGVSVTYSGVISNGTGAMTLTKTGAGTQILSGTNTYTGETTISAGTLQLNAGGVIATPIINNSVFAVNSSSAMTQGTNFGLISGTGTLTKSLGGTLTLNLANTFTGATIVNGGTLALGVGGSLSASSALQMSGGTFSYGNTAAGQTVAGLAVGAGAATVNNTATGQTLTLGAISRTAGLSGTVNFATLTGPISTTTGITNGIMGPWATTGSTTTLRYAVGSSDGSTPTNITAFTTGTTATAGTLASVTDSTLNYEYSATATTAADLTGNTLRYSGGISTTTIGTTNTLTLNGLMNAGTGTLTIAGPRTGTSGGIRIGSTGELVITSNAQTTVLDTVIGGTGRLVYSGAGTLTLGGTGTQNYTNTYTGGTVINSGTLRLHGGLNVNEDDMLGEASGGITLNGGTLRLVGVSIVGARVVTVNGVGSQIDVGDASRNFRTSGKLTGAGTLGLAIASGTQTTTDFSFTSTANDFTGRLSSTNTIINVNSFADGSNNIALNNATFNYGTGATAAANLSSRSIELSGTTSGATINNNNTASSHANTLTFGGVVTTGVGNKTLTLGGTNTGSNTISGSVTEGSGSVISLTKAGAGTWVLSAANSYTGATSITGGRLQLGSGTSTGSLSTDSQISVATGATFAVNQSDTVTQGTDFSAAAISGAGSFSQMGSGTTVLTAANTYTGATTVSAGTLLVNGSLGNSNVSVSSGARFGGTGELGGNLGLTSGSFFHVVNLNDGLAVTGTINLFEGFGVDDLVGLTWGSVATGTYTLISGTLDTGVFAGLANNSAATAFALEDGRTAYFQDGSLQLVVAIPEPRAALLGSLGMLMLLRRRR